MTRTRERFPPAATEYLFALGLTAAAVAARWLLDPALGERLALVTLFPVVAAAVWYGGYGPALAAAAVGYAACDYLFIDPRGQLGVPDFYQLVGLIAYLVSCAVIIGFGEALRSARSRADRERELLRTTLASIGDAVVTTDTAGRVTSLNPVAESLTGWSRADAAGRPLDTVFRIVNEETRAAVENPAARALRDGVVGLANHTVLIARDGTERPIDDSAAPIRDEHGNLAGCVLVFRDITDRKRAEADLARSESDLADFFDNASVGLHWVGPDGTILRVNQTELDLLGYAREEYVGRNIAEFHADRPVIDNILSCLARGETLREYPARLRCKDGSVRDVLINSNVLFEDGRFVHTRCFTRDVTEQKRAAEALRESERRFRLMADTAPAMLWVTEPDGACSFLSRGWYEFTGQTEATGLGFGWLDAVHPDDRADARATFLAANARREPLALEHRLRRADGEYRWVIDAGRPRLGPDGSFLGFIGSVIDITDRRRAEDILQASEEQYRTLFTSIDQGFCVVEILFDDAGRAEDYRFVEVNSLFEQQTGLTDPVGRTARELVPDLEPHWFELYGRVAATGEPARFTEGSEAMGRWFDVHAYRVGGPGSRRVAILFGDVTDRRRAEQELARLAEQLRLVTDAVPALISYIDAEGRYQFNNKAYEDWFGHPRGEIHGRHMREVLGDAAFERLRPHVEAALAGRRVQFEGEVPYKDGGTRHIHAEYVPDVRPDDTVAGYYVLVTDVTASRRAEAALRESEERFRQIAEGVDAVFYVTELPDRRVRYVSPAYARLWGLDPEELSRDQASWLRLIHPDDRPGTERAYDAFLAGGPSYDREYRVRLPGGAERWVRDRATAAARDPAGRITRVTGIAEDVTDRRQAEEALRDADRRKDEFLATLAHELRNPLAPIRNALEIAKLPEADRDALRRTRDTIERQLAHMVRLVDDLLDVSRITRDKLELRRTRVELASVVHQAVETCRPLAEREGQAVEVALPDEPVYLDADPVRLAQVFSNLLNNACKYTGRGGAIRLAARRDGGDVIVSVADTGIGIPPDKLASVFEMFEQVDRTLERSRGGLGIGLTLAKRLVELHGGTIEARSGGPGRGSEFVVRLSVLAAAPAAPPPPPAAADGAAPATRRILVVDDNRDSAESLSMLLSLTGHETELAYDGLAAVEAAERFRPDVVLLDIGMPKLNGLDACRRIRERPWGKGVVIVALTGWGQEEDRRKSAAAGFDAHMVKPVDYAALMDLLAEPRPVPT